MKEAKNSPEKGREASPYKKPIKHSPVNQKAPAAAAANDDPDFKPSF